MNHTKGPWHVFENDESGSYSISEASSGSTYKRERANANLISASPDMYEAMSEFLKEVDAHREMNLWRLIDKFETKFKDAIAKAEGADDERNYTK